MTEYFMLRFGYTSDLKEGYVDDLEDQSRLVAMSELINCLLDWWFTVSDYLDDGIST